MQKRKLWPWNVLLVITIIVCLAALIAHYRNWTQISEKGISVLSGFYYSEVPFAELDSVILMERMPPMERLHGFSAFDKEKGVFREFKDSLTDKKIHVYVDNFSNPKIKLVYRDSIKLYLNFKDSMENDRVYQLLRGKRDTLSGQFSTKN